MMISVLFFAAGLALAGPGLEAAQSKTERADTPPLQHQIVVTATRVEVPAREVGSAVTVLTRTDLERTRKSSLFEALRDALGLASVRNGGPGASSSIFIRGSNSEHVLVLLDGVPLNDPMNPSRSYDLAHLTLADVDRVEILRGPQSPLYGSDAMGGVINILTRLGAGRLRASLTSRAGSFGTIENGLEAGGQAGKLRYSLGLSQTSSAGISAAGAAYAGNSEPDGVRNLTGAFRLAFPFGDGGEADVSVRGVRARSEIDGFGGPYGDDPNSIQNYGSLFFRGQFRALMLDGRWEQKIVLSYSGSRRDHDNPVDADHPSDSETGTFRSGLGRFDWQNNLFLGPAHTLTWGVALERENGESTYRSESAWGPYESLFPRMVADRAGFYVQDHLGFGGRFFATAGLRIDQHSRTGVAATYRLAAALSPNDRGTRLKATVGTAFKSPSLYQLYAPGTFYGPIGNTGLRPERSLGWDAGIEQALLDGRLSLEAAYFRNDYRDLVDFDFSLGYVNIGQARTSGIELSADWRPREGARLRASYTRLAAKDLDAGTPLLRRPRDKAGLELGWAPARKWDLGLSASYIGRRTDSDFSVSPARKASLGPDVLLDAVVAFAPLSRLEIFVRAENIFDRRYETVFGYGAPGLAAYAGFKISL